uniref:Proteasome subunit beta 11 n=1 Tax=Fundulus heteroclitus TaxID=8078 RepID=A0A3Q2PR11_FUNHE
MALEDICNFKDERVQQLFPFPALETDSHDLELKRLKTSQTHCGTPQRVFVPPLRRVDPSKPPLSAQRPFPLSHGTTTLGFVFQGGVIAAADTRASAGGGADCMLWERILTREIRLYELRHKRRLSIRGSAKLLSLMLHPFKGTDVSPSSGPRLVYVCSDGARLQGDVISVGSGSPYAYGVLDGGLSWSLSKEEAVSLAREAVFRATHRDAYSGNNVDLFHVTAQGWSTVFLLLHNYAPALC